jgi:hypothetical protein
MRHLLAASIFGICQLAFLASAATASPISPARGEVMNAYVAAIRYFNAGIGSGEAQRIVNAILRETAG